MLKPSVRSVLWLLVLLLVVGLCGCGAPQQVDTKVSGSFVAKVRALSPDYVGDDFTPRVALLTSFQLPPFAVNVGEKIAAQLEVGESYCFEITEKAVGELSKEEFEKGCPEVETAIPLWNLRIKSCRVATEDERGMVPSKLVYTENGK